MTTKIEELKKAIQSLNEAILLHEKESNLESKKAFRDACIQRFEYSIELCWKVSMKTLGSNTAAAKPAIREMARNNLINNPEIWLSFIEARNHTSHSYDEDTAIQVFKKILEFYPEAHNLIQKLELQS